MTKVYEMFESAKAELAPTAIIGLMIALIFLAYLMPVGLDALATVNTSAWTTAEGTLFGLVGLFAVIGVVSKIAE